MAIKKWKRKRFEGIEWRSGHFYKFKYQAAQNDPEPHIIFMYAFSGTHPRTKRQWRFFQAINFSYIPRNVRQRFLNDWLVRIKRDPNNNFTWNKVKAKYPWLKIAVRRYFYSPGTYIINPEEIPFDDAQSIIVGTWKKDFSKKIIDTIRSKARKLKSMFSRKNKKKKKVVSEKRYKRPRTWTHKDTPTQHGL
jgi:hypothetical protein